MREKDHLNLNLKNIGSIEIDGELYPLGDLLGVGEDIDQEYKEQAALYGFLVTKTVEAEYEYNKASSDTELAYALADSHFRSHFKSMGQKTTESLVKTSIIQDGEYGDALEAELKAKRYYNILKGILRAMEQRSHMLSSLGAHRRAEFEMTNKTIKYDSSIGDMKKKLREHSKNQKQAS